MNDPLTLLLPVDGSPSSLAAVRHALRLAGAAGGRFVLVNVQEHATLYEVVHAADAERLAALKREAGADLLGPAEALLQDAGVEYECEVAAGTPERTILELAENYGADAIVMGAHGRDSEPGQVNGLGPVARAVLEASPLPVTIVRAPEADAAAEPGGDDDET